MTAVVTLTQLVDRPVRHPFFCAKCLVGDGTSREFFVHTGIEYDYEGVTYLCNKCLEEICKVTGVIFTKEQVDGIVEAYKNQAAVGKDKQERYDRACRILGAAGIELEALVERLENGFGIGKPGESRRITDSESEVVAAERDVADDDEQSLYVQREFDFHGSGVNPLIAEFDLNLGVGDN